MDTMDPEEQPVLSSRWTKLIKFGLVVYFVAFLVLLVGMGILIYFGIRYFRHQATPVSPVTNTQTVQPLRVADNAPALGSGEAPVTVVEFADFQCPFCKEFHDQVFPGLKTSYIDTGKVRFVFQDFAFLGPESATAAAAAKCAAEQQKFWPYHDLLYAKQGLENSGTFTADKLRAFAGQLGLNQSDFNSCVDSGRYDSAVQAETTAGSSFGVSATPTLFINGKKYEGVGSVKEYSQAIEEAVEATK